MRKELPRVICTEAELLKGTVFEHARKRGIPNLTSDKDSRLLREPIAGIHYPKLKK